MSNENIWKKKWKQETEHTRFYLKEINKRNQMIDELLDEKEAMVKEKHEMLNEIRKLRNQKE